MSSDVGIMISNEKRRKRVNLVEVGLSDGCKRTIGHYKDAEEALSALEGNTEDYEAIVVSGFRKR